MIKVAGMWELGWNTPIMEYDLWAFMLRDFGVDEICMAPVSGIRKDVREFSSLEEAMAKNADLVPVLVDEKGEVALQDFKHPENTLYVFGKASYSPLARLPKALSVRIETATASGLLWPHQAAAIVLYDRQVKQWQ